MNHNRRLRSNEFVAKRRFLHEQLGGDDGMPSGGDDMGLGDMPPSMDFGGGDGGGDDGGSSTTSYTPQRERILGEPSGPPQTETDASLDQVIDRYLLQYEKEAVALDPYEKDRGSMVSPPGPVAEVFRRGSLTKFLFTEQQQQQQPPAQAVAPSAPPGSVAPPLTPDASAGAEEETPPGEDDDDDEDSDKPQEPPSSVPVPKINIRRFAEDVARLVTNFPTLLNPKTIIIRRAMYYIAKNYSATLAKEFINILNHDFQMSALTATQRSAGNPPAPRSANVGPEGGDMPSGNTPSIGGGGGA